MPYIKPEAREPLNPTRYIYMVADNPGELNYQITELIKEYFLKNGENYQAINDVLGALEGAKAEFYRRVVVPYENKKKELNGDVYE